MNKNSRAVLALIGFGVLAGPAIPLNAAPAASKPQVMLGPPAAIQIVTDQDDGKTFTLVPETTLLVRVRTNPSTGFAWNVLTSPEMPLTLAGTPTYTPDRVKPGFVGAGGVEEFRFTPRYRAGFTQTFYLRLLSLRPFEKGVDGAKLWEVKVTLPPAWTPDAH